MPTLFVFLIKVNIALLLFCAGYYLVLRHLTFYTLNRIYLVSAILFATAYPKINLSDFAQQHQQITKPVQAIVFNWQAPAEKFVSPLLQPNYWYWAEVVFWIGAALLALRLLVQLFSLYKLYRNSKASKIYGHEVRLVNGNSDPFSFWKSIYINPANHEQADLKVILAHEQVHVNEWHTLDILLAELSTIFYWFNPGIWLMKKAVRENIEFLTDRKILNKGIDVKRYQYSLVNVSFSAAPQGIVNHFNISTIKKRIIMMNAKRSSKVKIARYAFLVPAVVVLLLVFSISKAALAKKATITFKSLITTTKATKTTAVENSITSVKNYSYGKMKPATSKIADTIKKGSFFISTSHHSDSLNYVINGKKSSKADFNALDTNRIYSIEIMPAEQARKIFNEIDNKNNVLFVTTDDSDAGKKFKEKIDKLNGIAYVNGNIVTISKGNGVIAATVVRGMDEGVNVRGENTAGPDVVIAETSPRIYKIKPIKIRAFKRGKDSTKTTVSIEPFESDDSTKAYSVYTFKNKTYSVNPKFKTGIKPNIAYRNVYKYNNAYTPKPFTVMASNSIDETSINYLSDKLILIDGKEATARELKKLSVADIKSISINNSDEATEKYGDKGKNGVVKITTKKAGK